MTRLGLTPAASVEVLFESRDGGLGVRIRDDGVGFTPAENADAPPGHLGLPSMRERVENERPAKSPIPWTR